MFDQSYTDYVYYVGNEIKYGCTLYLSGWKKLLLHPIQTVKDTAYALYHPIETGKILLNEVRQHPIGITVNISLSWATGRAIGSGFRYLRATNINSSAGFSDSLAKNSAVSDSVVSSTVAQVVQMGAQTMTGGCCGGICTTTIGRIGQTASLVTSQSAASAESRQNSQTTYNSEPDKKPSSFLSYFWKTEQKDKDCKSTSCATSSCSTERTADTSASKLGFRTKTAHL